MSTIFGHGRLRLYLLKLLDESPRHGYEIISLLRDRFLGVYSPSPGTIYPRLARLEEEGLVTHEEVNGRKVYRLTDKGREELRNRSSDLDDLEREITDSVRDVARAVKQDVRDTISSLREELKFAAGGGRRSGGAGEKAGSGAEDSEQDTGEHREEEREGRSGTWWERDWEKLAQGLGSWGGSWGKHEKTSERPDFEHALRDFSERVRNVVRDAGHAGESTSHNLRRILDDTIEVIRRDLASWGPRESDEEAAGTGEGTAGTAEREEEDRDTTAKSGTAYGPTSQPTADPRTEDRGEAPASGDPWSTAIHEEQEAESEDRDEPGPGGQR
ncbi:PadR family transcriptional regulator [Allosalinactinospora lopnorensis]|uniref:PadR family transcriptional regulator n=1 Tax=Allosalinactinospora lopnorensis TaxID=1352348 RepID=UPI000623C40C|nr:PadR family transcriptional regulator [Allosalinactinospora lopnorensis]